jgi:hypothetical protein
MAGIIMENLVAHLLLREGANDIKHGGSTLEFNI